MDRAAQRLEVIRSHLNDSEKISGESSSLIQQSQTGGISSPPSNNDNKGPSSRKKIPPLLESESSSHHQGKEKFKWNGWGYDDTAFLLNEKGDLYLTGKRYALSGVAFPKLRPWAETNFGLDTSYTLPAQKNLPPVPKFISNPEFLNDIKDQYAKISTEDLDRLHHAHGHTADDIWRLRYGKFERVPDLVIWPSKQEHVEIIVKAAVKHNVVIIPYGGGTSVTNAIEPPASETRMIVSLDMHEMNKIRWIDYDSMMASIEAGVVGKDLDAKLAKLGVCVGHEPDSSEWSTLGGWVATRASGMKKNVYGNIDDLLVSVTVVTPQGTLRRADDWPRISSGPDLQQLILGSEGTLGVVTDVVLKIRNLPETRRYGSVVFPDFESGVAFMREVAKQRCAPASIRLVDNMQFQFGQVLKPESHSPLSDLMEQVKKWYVTKYKKFEIDKMVAATLLFEGSTVDVDQQEAKVYAIANKYGGLKGGEENGSRGYFLTYMIAYIRDFGLEYGLVAESFECSVSWANVLMLCEKVKDRIVDACKRHGVGYNPFVSARVTQTYDVGAAIYFYFAFFLKGLEDPLKVYLEIEDEARDEVLKCGGSISHHHGIGKLRKKFMPRSISDNGVQMLRGVKQLIDPKNIFANGNLV